jgi:hypothetical protein
MSPQSRPSRSAPGLLFGLIFALGCGPLGPLPGGQLSGELEPTTPSDWAFADEEKTVQLETNPSDPYSVNVWGAGIGAGFFLAAGGGSESKWAQNIARNPEVRLRIDGRIYELRAVRVDEDPKLREDFLAAVKRKYDWDPPDDETQKAWLYRLDSR